ncbi:MAG: Abi family protein [[Eubacterium] siraeum]
MTDLVSCKQLTLLKQIMNIPPTGTSKNINKLIKLLGDKYVNNRTDYHYIEHTKTKHGNLPLWVLINALTFGNISKMYSLFTQSLRISISKNYAYLNEKPIRSNHNRSYKVPERLCSRRTIIYI